MVIEEAINEGATHFDFLTGTEPYKFRWANSIRRNMNFIYWENKRDYILSNLYLRWNKLLRIPINICQSKL